MKSRIPIEEHKPWPGKVYTYFVVDEQGHVVEGNLPSEENAWTVIDYWKSQGVYGLEIYVENIPQVRKGFGRDPDLH